jgi:outer membrane protein assembly factor BamB
MQDIEIRFGNSWKEDEIFLAQHRRSRVVNLNNIVDVVDILIDGANISVRAPRDAIFLLLRDMLARVEELLSGKSSRVGIAFYESSWELVLVLEGELVLLSFYRAGARPRIEVKDRPLGLKSLMQAVVAAGELLIEDLLSISPQMVADPFVSELMGAMERIRTLEAEGPAAGSIPVPSSFTIDYDGRGKGSPPLTFGCEVRATSRDLLAAVMTNRSDLYALMGRGTFTLHVGDNAVSLDGLYVFFLIEKLLEAARSLMASIEDYRNLELALSVEDLELEVRYDCAGGTFDLSIRNKATLQPPCVLRKLDPSLFVDELVKLARSFRRRVIELNPSQRSNLKLEIFNDEIESLMTWRKDIESQPVRKQAPSPLRFEVPASTLPEREERGRSVFSRTKKLMYVRLWEAEVEGIRLDASYLAGDRIVLTGGKDGFAVHRETGEVLWRKKLAEPDALSLMAGEAGILRFDPHGMLRLIDVKDGETVWTTRITPPFGVPSGTVAGGGRRPRYAVLTSGESSLIGIDLYTGEARWKHRTRRGSSYRFAKFGKLLFMTCSTNAVHCIDVDSGELLWRYCGRHKFMDAPVTAGGAAAVWGREWGERMGRLVLFDSLTGNELWSAQCEGRLAASPVFSGGVLCGAFYIGHDLLVRAWKTDGGERLWERDLGAIASFFSWMPIDDRIVMNMAGGMVICLKAEDGTVVWSKSMGSSSEDVPMNLEPILRGGGLFVPADTTYVFSPSDGTLLHRLEEHSPVPDFLRVDERYSIYVGEVSGYVGAYGVSGHLGVIEP